MISPDATTGFSYLSKDSTGFVTKHPIPPGFTYYMILNACNKLNKSAIKYGIVYYVETDYLHQDDIK